MPRVRQPELIPGSIPSRALPKEKTSFSLSPEVKFKLATLKANIRRQGHRATESAIVEVLIWHAKIDESLIRAVGDAHGPRRSPKSEAS
jgi:predicted transcriptional regulator